MNVLRGAHLPLYEIRFHTFDYNLRRFWNAVYSPPQEKWEELNMLLRSYRSFDRAVRRVLTTTPTLKHFSWEHTETQGQFAGSHARYRVEVKEQCLGPDKSCFGIHVKEVFKDRLKLTTFKFEMERRYFKRTQENLFELMAGRGEPTNPFTSAYDLPPDSSDKENPDGHTDRG